MTALRASRREPVEVAEPRRPDNTMARVASIRTSRLQRLEADLVAARQAWRREREAVRQAIAQARQAQQDAIAFWHEAMQAFTDLCITSADLQRAKAVHHRLRLQAQDCRVQVRRQHQQCIQAREQRHRLEAEVLAQRKQVEKLALWRELSQEPSRE